MSAEFPGSMQTCRHIQKHSFFHGLSASSPPAPSAPASAVASPALAFVCPPASPRARRYDLRKERERGRERGRGRGRGWRMGGKGDREREHSAASFEQPMATFRHTLLCSPPRSRPSPLPSSLPASVPPSLLFPSPPSLYHMRKRAHTHVHTRTLRALEFQGTKRARCPTPA
jgi:hypothetical protein